MSTASIDSLFFPHFAPVRFRAAALPLIKEPSHKATQLARKELQQELVKFRIPDIAEKKKLSQEVVRQEE